MILYDKFVTSCSKLLKPETTRVLPGEYRIYILPSGSTWNRYESVYLGTCLSQWHSQDLMINNLKTVLQLLLKIFVHVRPRSCFNECLDHSTYSMPSNFFTATPGFWFLLSSFLSITLIFKISFHMLGRSILCLYTPCGISIVWVLFWKCECTLGLYISIQQMG